MTISYERAQALHEAGYPQIENPTYGQGYWHSENGGEGVYTPLLSELIDACGESVYFEYKVDLPSPEGMIKGCRALKIIKIAGGPDVQVYTEIGSDLDEAVAKLWLMLKRQGIIKT